MSGVNNNSQARNRYQRFDTQDAKELGYKRMEQAGEAVNNTGRQVKDSFERTGRAVGEFTEDRVQDVRQGVEATGAVIAAVPGAVADGVATTYGYVEYGAVETGKAISKVPGAVADGAAIGYGMAEEGVRNAGTKVNDTRKGFFQRLADIFTSWAQ
jgi:hypothetical protein